MARGSAPSSPDRIANSSRAKKEAAMLRVVKAEAVAAPKLPSRMPDGNAWPKHTLTWWKSWVDNPLTDDYRESDWLDLIDCAAIHARLWSGDYKAASELRLRVARHGATKEDRARLRITFATADSVEANSTRQVQRAATERRRSYTGVDGTGT